MTAYFIQNALLFTRTLRRAGLPVSLEQTIDFTRALTLVNIGSREQVYHTARCLLLTNEENGRLFDIIFNRFWRTQPENAPAQKAPIAPRHLPKQREPFNVMTYMAYKVRQSDPDVDVTDKSQTYSHAELLQHKQFSQMSPEELETIKRLMQEMKWQMALRQTRRRVIDRKGHALHLRGVLRSAAKMGGVPVQLAWQRKKVKKRPIILIADISGSMERYARLVLQFFYSVSHSLKEVECFVFATRLTRITADLRLKNIDRAIDEATRVVADWAGGTRIGDSLRTFNQQWSRRVLRRGAIVLLISDGWERGDVTVLKNEMRYLNGRCHRLIWLNPLSGQASYQPTVEGMAAALPYIDDFLPIHNLQSLTELSQHLGRLGKRKGDFYGTKR